MEKLPRPPAPAAPAASSSRATRSDGVMRSCPNGIVIAREAGSTLVATPPNTPPSRVTARLSQKAQRWRRKAVGNRTANQWPTVARRSPARVSWSSA